MTSDAPRHVPEDRLFHEIAGRLTPGLIHEINNPLAVVMGYAQEALADPTSPHIPEDLAEIVNESRRIAQLLSDWRTMLRGDMETGESDLRATLALTWRLFAWRARGSLIADGAHVPDDQHAGDPPSTTEPGDPWPSVIAPAEQVQWWGFVLMYFLEHLPGRTSGTLELRSTDHTLRIHLAADSPGPLTDMASDCRQAASNLAQRHGAAISWPDDLTLTISLA